MNKHLLLAALLVLGGNAAVITAQPPTTDPASDPRKVRTESKDRYKRWVDEDAGPIITAEEREAFKRLRTDEERENFIESFWRRRDPNTDTEENEYREEYYERIAYANEHYTSGIPGWKTDRGRIYIKWGKPDSIESRPSGGAYDRPAYEGGGSTTTYPFEVWFYRNIDGVGNGIEIEFVDRSGTGEYKIARSPDEKDALATVPGIGRRNNGDPNGAAFLREQDSPFRRMEILNGLERQPPVKYGDILEGLGRTSSGTIENDLIHFDVRVDMFRQSEDRVAVVFTVQADNQQLVFEPVGGIASAKMNIIGRITAVSGKPSGLFEEAVTTSATAEDLRSIRARNSVYQKAVALPPGRYKIDVGVRDVSSGNKGVNSISFEVPRYDAKKLSTSTLVLASKLRATDPDEIGARFVIGGAKVIPNLSGRFKQGQDIGIYMQVYNAGIDQTTLRPSVDVDYVVVAKSGRESLREREDWRGLSDSSQRLTLARLLPTARLDVGEYELRAIAKDRVSGQTVEQKSQFTIEK
jgi:GWxTD domain-containing protein